MFDEDVDGHLVLLVLLVDEEGFLVQAVFRSDPCNVGNVVVGELVDVAHDLALVGTNRGKHQQVLQVLVLAERRRLQDDLLEQLNQLDRKVCRQERLDGDRNIVRICAFRNGGCDDLRTQ